MEINKNSWKKRSLYGIFAGAINGLALLAWDYFQGNDLQTELYVFQALVMGVFIAIASKNKVAKR
ncbi:hypothetical protein ACFSQP_03925 [Bizionia sediminis]|uniref:Gliding motility protein GldL n=1 Tax=Bizionia sediminis TaxID=1737064 RepID=A0ABW5KRH5_9FLAO